MRTSQEIVDQTNELARRLAERQGYAFASRHEKLYESPNPRARLYWGMACVAQEELTDTDAENALAELYTEVSEGVDDDCN